MNRMEFCRCGVADRVYSIGTGREGVVQGKTEDNVLVRWRLDSGKWGSTQRVGFHTVDTAARKSFKLKQAAADRAAAVERMFAGYSDEVRKFSIALNLPPKTVQLVLRQEGRE